MQNFKILNLIFGIALIISLGANFILLKKNISEENLNNAQASLDTNIIESDEITNEVSAEKIYSLFECSCCGNPISECTCPMAQERKNYIDVLMEVGENMSKEEIILAYVRKYGLNSFIDENRQKEIREKLVAEAPSDRPIISIIPDSYDFGDVSQKEGNVYAYFDLKNEGESDLVIDRLETSCGCTFAAIVYQGEEGPYFTMPGHEETPDWEGVTIPPGKTAQLKVMYDPNVHKDFRGAAIREIHVFSNDPVDFERKVIIDLNQVD